MWAKKRQPVSGVFTRRLPPRCRSRAAWPRIVLHIHARRPLRRFSYDLLARPTALNRQQTLVAHVGFSIISAIVLVHNAPFKHEQPCHYSSSSCNRRHWFGCLKDARNLPLPKHRDAAQYLTVCQALANDSDEPLALVAFWKRLLICDVQLATPLACRQS